MRRRLQFSGYGGHHADTDRSPGSGIAGIGLLSDDARTEQHRLAQATGAAAARLIESGIIASDIITAEAIENALVIHAAAGGSTNAMLHLPALARKRGLAFSWERVREINDDVPWMLNLRPSGEHTADLFWYAGGVPRLMWEVRDQLHLDALTVTGRTLGENLEQLECRRDTSPPVNGVSRKNTVPAGGR